MKKQKEEVEVTPPTVTLGRVVDKQIRSVEQLQAEWEKLYLTKDKGAMWVFLGAVIGNQLDQDPIWLHLIAPPSSGKCLKKGTKVLCYDGTFKMVQDVRPGDLLMGDNSEPRKVLSTCSGEEMMYEVQQERGVNYTVNAPHILTLQHENGKVFDIGLPDYLKKSTEFKKRNKGFKVPVSFKEKKVLISPYWLGLWLGDGRQTTTGITKEDKEVVEHIKKYAGELSMNFSEYSSLDRTREFAITKSTGKRNKLKDAMDSYGLKETKFIPHDYKANSREIQLEILAGLLDTDGHLNKKSMTFDFISKYEQLSEDVAFVARSLGLYAKVSKCTKRIKSAGFSGTYYRVYISGDTHIIPTRVPRKQAKQLSRRTNVLRTGIKIKKLRKGTYYGFTLDGNGRFLLEDFTVTHNTEYIDSIRYVKRYNKNLVFPISDLTVNTFASGSTKDSSLLNQVFRGAMVVFKDFTSMISKEPIAQKAIMGQLREIYDKRYVERTGNGKKVVWEGKIGVVTGCTEVIYNQTEEFSAMGDRFMMYKIEQPDTMAALNKVYDNERDGQFAVKRDMLHLYFKDYIEHCFEHLENVPLEIAPETISNIMKIVHFTTQVSSGLIVDSKKDNRIEFVPDKTMPMRMFKQVLGIARSWIFMNRLAAKDAGTVWEGDLTEEQIKYLYKLCFDSIPIRRRLALQVISKYELGTTTAGLATKLGYQTPVVAGWMAQLNGLGIVRREKDGVTDKWFLKPEYQKIMVQFEGITPVQEAMEDGADEWYEKVKAMEYSPSNDWEERREALRSMGEDPSGL